MDFELVKALLPAVFAGGGAYWAVRTELLWLRRDLDRLEERVLRLEQHQLASINSNCLGTT